jgi:hypothetical protein
MFWTVVPEATVHKKGHASGTEYKIWFAKDRLVPPPAGDAGPSEYAGHHKFGFPVPAPSDVRHDFRTLQLREDVCHSSNLHNINGFIECIDVF